MDYIVAASFFAVAGGAVHCASLTRRDRNYWPMLRVLWACIAFVYGGSAFGTLVGAQRNPTTRAFFAAAALFAVGYSVWFMHKRNRTPRFVRLTVGGEFHLIPLDELSRAAELVESWARHGAMPAERAASVAAALAEWRAYDAWRKGMARQARELREGGIPDGAD